MSKLNKWIIEEVNPVKWENKNYNKCHTFLKANKKIVKKTICMRYWMCQGRTREIFMDTFEIWEILSSKRWFDKFLTTFCSIEIEKEY